MKHLQYFFTSVVLFLVSACGSSDEAPADNGSKYFPLKVGNSWIYDVSEVTFDTLIQNVVAEYQEKFEVIDSFKNQLNENTYVVHIFKRNKLTDAWESSETWTAKISNLNEVIVNEENIPYIKMILPVREGVSWLGNKYNTIEADRNNSRVDNFTYQNVTKPFGDYTNTLTVEESNDVNLIYKDVRMSVYAKNIGLVYQINNYIDYCDDNDCLGLHLRKHEHTKILNLAEHGQ